MQVQVIDGRPTVIRYGSTHVDMPHNVLNIGNGAFRNSNIVSVWMPSVEIIGENAFEMCNALEHIFMPKVTEIKHDGFRCCTHLRTINLPHLIHIDDTEVFESCSRLIHVHMPRIEFIGGSCFADCIQLSYVIIPNVIDIFHNAFSFTQIKHINIPRCQDIGAGAFERCPLERFIAPSLLCAWEGAFQECTHLTRVDFPKCEVLGTYEEEITARGTFHNCITLQKIHMPNIKIIHKRCFNNCFALQPMVLPDTLERLHPTAFLNCTTELVIPERFPITSDGLQTPTVYYASPQHYTAAEHLNNAKHVIETIRIIKQTAKDSHSNDSHTNLVTGALMIVKKQLQTQLFDLQPWINIFYNNTRMAQMMLNDVYTLFEHMPPIQVI